MVLYSVGKTKASLFAAQILEKNGFTLIDHPSPDITHLLLDVPSFRLDGMLRSGDSPETILERIPANVHILGGNLTHPLLTGSRTSDLLRDPVYLAQNASITADCAIRLSGTYMDRTFSDSRALVIGWGRIGKCLAAALKKLGCKVTVSARKESDRAMLCALGFDTVCPENIPHQLFRYSILFNTVPAPVLSVPVPETCLALELASSPGISGDNILSATGLPGKMAPKTSGKLIADTILRFLQEDTL